MKRFISIVLMLTLLNASVYAQPGTSPDFSTLSSWSEADVKKAYDLNILQPYMARDFKRAITREEFCDMCTSVISKWYDCDFTDVQNIENLKNIADKSDFSGFNDTGVWYIEFCAKLGIVSGKGNGKFEPEMAITREEAAKMLYNTLDIATPVLKDYGEDNANGVNGIFLPHVFEDGIKIQNWARNEINAVYHLGIMMGNVQNEFEPQGTYTREQAVCTFLRLYNAYKNPDENTMPDLEIYPSPDVPYVHFNDSYYIDAAYQWGTEGYKYEPQYYDGFGNSYSAQEKGYVYPLDKKYMEVLTCVGVGVHRETVIDKSGKEVIDDCDTVEYLDDNYAVVDEFGQCMLYNFKTGEKTVLESFVSDVGCGIKSFCDKNGLTGYMNSEYKIVMPCVYKQEQPQKFLNDLCVFKKQDNSFIIVNTKGEILKTFTLDLNKYWVESVYGTNMLLKTKNNETVLFRAYSGKYVTGYQNIYFIDNGEMIGSKDGKKYFLDLSGNVKADLYKMGYDDCEYVADGGYFMMFKIDKSNWSRITPFDIMDGNGNIIRRNINCYSYAGNFHIKADKSGVTAYKTPEGEIIVFDSYGKDIGVIKSDKDITDFDFINGLIRITTYEEADGFQNSTTAYYTPDGKEAVSNAVKIVRDELSEN